MLCRRVRHDPGPLSHHLSYDLYESVPESRPICPECIDPDVALDVQLALDTVYDAFNYELSLDYTRPAEIPLVGEAAAWAAEHLRQAGIVMRSE